MTTTIDDLRSYLDQISIRDAHRLSRALDVIVTHQQKKLPVDKHISRFENDLAQALDQQTKKAAAFPVVSFPDALPVSQKRDDIAALIQAHQVVVIAGETGSGKTTQIPKILLSIGRGLKGRIAHTQPRRIAARTVASRIADELAVPLGSVVGYQVRFHDQSDSNTYIKLMTDGVLLAEIQHDPLLLAYDTIIVDEAHERSLNIDFLLGYLKQLLSKRADLKLIVTSATIDVSRFSEHFNRAPVVEVSGRTFPVATLYRPWHDADEDLTTAVVNAVDEIISHYPPGDILIFMSGEREIREVSHELKKAEFPHLEILPLYARLSIAEQNRIFNGHKGRRVILATNVAETSITVPGIKYVIDPGYARISRYSFRTKVQRLPVEAISQASANQRKGRCGRTSDGVCFRLYAEEDFNQRPEFTDPEILRTNLAAVILQMLHMRLGDVRHFPFLDKPDNRLISDGFKLLEEVRAVAANGKVTASGRQLSQLPIDPRLGAVILAAQKLGCLHEALIIVAALSIQDPRERPADKKQAADEKHRRFWDEHSDFTAYLNLWNYYEEQRQALSQNQLRKLCQKEYINFLRMREWRDLHHQLKLASKKLGFKENVGAVNYESLHKAIICGYLTHIGLRDKEQSGRDYEGTRQKRFMVFPGSSQAKKKHQWLVAAEFIETSQLYAHCVAKIEPEWVLEYGEHLIKRHYFEPHYDVKAGQVRAFVRTSLFGLVLQEKKRVAYGHIDEKQASEVFIREALVEGKYRGKGEFFQHNQALIAEVHELEAKSRRRDILVDDQQIFDFYQQRVPENISNLKGFEYWRQQAERDKPDVLYLDKSLLMLHSAAAISEQQYPKYIQAGDYTLEVHYQFEPGHAHDGVNVKVPVEILHAINDLVLEWTVPGVRRDKCIALVKALPKSIRKHFVPVPQYVDRALSRLKPGKQKLSHALGEALSCLGQVKIEADMWDESQLDDFYQVNIQVVDDKGSVIDQSRDIQQLRQKYRARVQKTLASVGDGIEKTGLTQWSFGELEATISLDKGSVKIKAYPALISGTDSVDLKILDNPDEAYYKTRQALLRLASIECAQTVKYLKKQLLKGKDLGLTLVNIGARAAVVDDIILASIDDAIFTDHEMPRNEATFQALLSQGKSRIVACAETYEALLSQSLNLAVGIKKQIKSSKNPLAIALAANDIQQQLDNLFYPHFLVETPLEHIQQYPRFLEAIVLRLDKVPQNPSRDGLWSKSLREFWQWHTDRLAKEGTWSYRLNPEWQSYRWMLEELRVSLFAQTLKTRMPVSEKRVKKQWENSLR